MVRVKPSILPPTMMMAPTSAAARPNPASSAVTRENRASQTSVTTRRGGPDIHRGQFVAIFDPQVFNGLARERGDYRSDQNGLRDHHGLRREQQTPVSERARTRQGQKNRQPHHHRRQAHHGIEHDDGHLAARKTDETPSTRRSARRSAPQTASALRLTISDSRTMANSPGSPVSTNCRAETSPVISISKLFACRSRGSTPLIFCAFIP